MVLYCSFPVVTSTTSLRRVMTKRRQVIPSGLSIGTQSLNSLRKAAVLPPPALPEAYYCSRLFWCMQVRLTSPRWAGLLSTSHSVILITTYGPSIAKSRSPILSPPQLKHLMMTIFQKGLQSLLKEPKECTYLTINLSGARTQSGSV